MANFSLYLALFTPTLVTISLRLRALDVPDPAASLSLILGVGGALGLIAGPLFGRLSDRTTGPFGRRRPWIVAGAIVGFIGMAVVATASSVPVILAGWCVTTLAYNAALVSILASVPDQVPEDRRGGVSGIIQLTQNGAQLFGAGAVSLLSGNPVLQFMGPAVLALIVLIIFAVALADRGARHNVAPFSVKEFLASYWVNPRRHPRFAWAWLSLFLVMLGLVVPMSYNVMLLGDRVGIPEDQLAGKAFIAMACNMGAAIVASYVGGVLSDKVGRRKVFLVGAALTMAVGLTLIGVTTSFAVVLAGMVVGGLGGGVFFAVNLALIIQVLPSSEASGKDMGVVGIANSLPQSLTPAVAPLFLWMGGYPALYAFAAIAVIIGGFAVIRVRGVR